MTIDVQNVADQTDAISSAERRRLGRADVSPTLIELLRAPAKDADLPEDLRRALEDEGELPIEVDPIAPARGIALGVALSVPIWAGIGGLIYTLVK
ncbi:hypothetical protein [Acidisphaera sp. L21]|uniref:hypothetical protein n=1 Tax=Acidisphaera sp. L21 TaxID=1641851 RepID=UPI00131B0029|nr:hypothetical protein [Acidisphaera sp. L21]